MLASFGPEGPTRCSGLPVQRYSAEEVSGLLGPAFHRVASRVVEHSTPQGARQQFMYGLWSFTG